MITTKSPLFKLETDSVAGNGPKLHLVIGAPENVITESELDLLNFIEGWEVRGRRIVVRSRQEFAPDEASVDDDIVYINIPRSPSELHVLCKALGRAKKHAYLE